MSRAARLRGNAAAALVGTIVGGLLVLATQGATVPAPSNQPRPKSSAWLAGPRVDRSGPAALLAWSVGGLPPAAEKAIDRVPGTIEATSVYAGLDWIESSRSPDGSVLDAPPKGMSIPFEMAVVEPREYAQIVPPGEGDLVRSLERGEVLIPETEARLRGAGEGLELELASHRARVSGVISDAAANGYEALMRPPIPVSWARADRFVLAVVRNCSQEKVRRALEPVLEPGRAVRIRCGREQPFLRYGDSVLPQLLIKETFGEFAARPSSSTIGAIEVDPAWRAANIKTASLPELSSADVTCHRAIFPQLRGALRDLASEGLSYLIDRDDFAGCYAPRFIERDPDGRLSHHSWGIALDINRSENTPGAKANQDSRLVEIMREWGFTWGGGWLYPDGMHFEWLRWAP